jgi:hypothetical protein
MRRRAWTIELRAVLAGLLACAGGLACSGTRASDGARGHVSLALTLPDGDVIDKVTYVVQAPPAQGIVSLTGTIIVTNPSSSVSIEVLFPPSSGDEVILDAVTHAGLTCHGVSAPFDIGPGQTTVVDVTLRCDASTPPAPGAVAVTATLATPDDCPVITSWSVSPLQFTFEDFNHGVDVAVGATVPANPTAPLAYAWSAVGCGFADPHSAATRMTCEGPAGPGDSPVTFPFSVAVTNPITGATCTAVHSFSVVGLHP